MLSINLDDVMQVLTNVRGYLIAFGVVALLAIVVMIAVRKLPKAKKKMIRAQAGLAILLALTIVVNLICTGPMSTMLDLVSGSGTITEETSAKATELVNEITADGVVLAKDEDGILPVASGSKLNVFGWASTNPCYGGTGSGALNTAYPVTDLLTGLHDAGIETNEELSKFYTDYKADRPSVGMVAQDWTLPEPNVSLYTDEMMENAKAFSDTAMVVITRVGGEGADLPTDMASVVDGSWIRRVAQAYGSERGTAYYNGTYDDSLNEGNDWDKGDHFLQLSNREEDLLDLVTANFDNVILVYNGANAFQMDFLKDYPQIKGVLLCPGTGQSGFEGFGKVVSGEVNPSGRTVDTYVSNLKNAPWWNNFGDFKYTNTEELNSDSSFFDPEGTTPSFVNYVEGIYVGYKFYETAADEGLINYDDEVVFPFGYGLSYTSFTKEMSGITNDGTSLNFTVTVTNTGSVAGKDVVEIYSDPPYTNGGIEKSSANLLDFAKTNELAPGESQTIEFSIPVEDLASYDYQTNGCYVLEAGDYVISANDDSHNVADSQTYTVASDIVYNESNKRGSDAVAATNEFDFAEGEITYLSRADGFANYAEATAAPATYEMTDEQKAAFDNAHTYTEAGYQNDDDANAADITTGAKNGLKLVDLRGVDYNDAKWDQLLDQMTIDEMQQTIGFGGYQTAAVSSIEKVRTNDCDGPASINNNFTGVGSVGFPAATLIGMTWDKDLAYAFGDSIGEMANEMDTSGWYGPAMNIHRTAFAGRNFEYYSEDGVLSGRMASNAILGAQEHGVYAYMKHFALNDQEGNRTSMAATWSNEQAIREIYLKPFEISVKDADCHAVMSSFNYIGTRWAGGCKELLKNVLRGEWGFMGFVETDYFGVYGYMTADQGVRNGCDLMLCTTGNDFNTVTVLTNSSKQALREASKNILYTVVNSRAYAAENLNPGMAKWEIIMIGADVLVALLIVALEIKTFKSYKKRKEEEEENA
ncbi:glycoside hydrolase family 3 N-terminal domain-containing protein [Faecalibacterium prausnitzii]|uniref:glycoside hydrolase family 3 N-terminal domain-containing protein n=1 Tax=Faecalibacterium prausnitzii TaxID=853 RepID=UPI0022E40015|nr:glycoside hydrolase family 3 N-terminal domain-containing protein [Faecalibacterium prausnitzii]